MMQEINPYLAIPRSAANSAAHRALALQTAREGIVLLTNPTQSLPLNASSFAGASQGGSLALVGPNSDQVLYHLPASTGVLLTLSLSLSLSLSL